MERQDDSFQYTYSAAQQAEVERIRRKYLQPEESKLDQLRKLDRSVSAKARTTAISLGTAGALILGTGMSFVMTELGQLLHFSEGLSMLIGIIAGLVGLVQVALAYPVYNRVLRKERQRLAPMILQLTEELLQ